MRSVYFMESLVHSMLNNAMAAVVLTLAVAALGRLCRRPALTHCLWLVVLVKLITPAVVFVSLPSAFTAYVDHFTGRREMPAPLQHYPFTATYRQQPHDRLDSLKVRPQLQRATSDGRIQADDRLETTIDALTRDMNDSLREERPVIESGSHREPLPVTEVRSPARALATPTWVIRPIAKLACLQWETAVLFVVLSGAVAWWSLALVRIIRFHRLLKDGPLVPQKWQDQSDELAEQLGIARRPQVHLVPGQVPPMLWAIGGRPKVLIPSQLWPTLDPSEQVLLLLHELAHLRRRDHWVRWLEFVVGGLYWWHPAVWWARRGLREAEEQCCDAWVIWAMPRAAKTYAAALVAALEFVSGGHTALAAASATSGSGHVACLKRRLRMIVRASTPRSLSWFGRLAVLGMAALILPLAPTWAQNKPAKPDQTGIARPKQAENNKLQAGAAAQREFRASVSLTAGVANDDEDDKKDEKRREAAKRLEDQASDLIEKLAKDFAPVGEEFRRALERAVGEVHRSLEKENASPDDLRKALEKSQDELRRALEQGGPIDHELREAWERAHREVHDAWERARDDIHQAMRDRVETARQREQAKRARERAEQGRERPEHPQPEAGGGRSAEQETREHRQEVEDTRREIRELEQQLRRATRRLEELDRREARREQRRAPARPRAEGEPPRAPAGPRTKAAPRPESAPGAPSPPVRPGQRNARRPPGTPGAPGTERPSGPMPRSDYERRFRNLEDKLNQLLKELQDMKREQRSRTSAKVDARVVTIVSDGMTNVG
jgi:beta-lactamase regulating signal transducer with metallopeptidase domain